MVRHFLGLYLLIVATLAIVSWGQDRLLQVYSSPDAADDRTTALIAVIADRVLQAPAENRGTLVSEIASRTGVDMELFSNDEIAGGSTLERLNHGEDAYMRASSGDSWVLRRIDGGHVLALKSRESPRRGALEWGLTILFYALIALVLMFWIWPLRRDLRVLERAASTFGNRNWRFSADIQPGSQIYPLAETFRKMAARIDALIGSHKDMSNAVSHEIKTPLSRMQFEIELARDARSLEQVRSSLANIKSDIDAIDGLVKATLGYAILERADLSLNLAAHDFTGLVPGIVESARHDMRADLEIQTRVDTRATQVVCDVHLFETVLKNLLYNAGRYSVDRVDVVFEIHEAWNELRVEDDGPGIPERERSRVFQSFVQLDPAGEKKTGYGLGLAIVKRAIEWHGGEVYISDSVLGGACVGARWPVKLSAVS